MYNSQLRDKVSIQGFLMMADEKAKKKAAKKVEKQLEKQ